MDQMQSYSVDGASRTRKKKKRGGALAAVLIVVLMLVLCVVLIARSGAVKYINAMLVMAGEEYSEALNLFQQIPGFMDADHYAKLCTYRLAVQSFETENYAEAAERFHSLGDFENASEWYQVAVYEAGHACFEDQSYDEADAWFDRLNGVYPENALRHFKTLDAAVAYLKENDTAREGQLHCYVGQMPEAYRDKDYLWQSSSNFLFHRSGSVSFDWEENTLFIDVVYFPSDAILEAWRSGDHSTLSDEEKAVLDNAVALVAEARAENPESLAMEIWLHDWLCENIEYDNPNMDVETEEYLKLRQLTCIGALMDGKANCQGYTDAFYLLGTIAGLKVGKISGEAEEPHTWNSVYLNDTWYLVDITFDDMGADSLADKTYIYLNCALDTDTYQIDGEEALYSHLSMDDDPEVTYYGYNDCAFENIDDAVLYMLRCHAKNGAGVTYAVVLDDQVDSADMYRAVEQNMGKAGIYSVEWDEYITCYDGNTYLTIYWK